MICDKELWHKASDIPKPKSSIILVHHYYGGTAVCDAYVHDDGRHFSHHSFSREDWFQWEWKIEKWCYVDDLVKVKHISFE